LHRLETVAFWLPIGKNRDRARGEFYRLTAKSLSSSKTETADWQRLIDAIGLILGMADGGAR